MYGCPRLARVRASVQPVCKIPILESMRRDAGDAARRSTAPEVRGATVANLCVRRFEEEDRYVRKRGKKRKGKRVSCVKSIGSTSGSTTDGYDESKSGSLIGLN